MSEIKYVITIERQFGSMGQPIARKLSELLGIKCYDNEIIDAAAKMLNLPVSLVDDNEESAISQSGWFKHMNFPQKLSSASDIQNRIFNSQQEIIRSLAKKESCIIVGRCADFALEDMDNVVNIYIYAPYDVRLMHCVNDLKLEEAVAKKTIMEVDKARDAYHLNYAGYKPADPLHKDILINSDFLGIEKTAKLLAEAIKKKFNVQR